MIDWLVLLVPLVALPIVSLFAFFGCQLVFPGNPYDGFWPIVGLHYPEGLQTDVETLTITFEFTLDSGESPSGLTAMETLTKADIEPVGEFIDRRTQVDLREQGEGKLKCTCIITKTGSSTPITRSDDQTYGGDAEDSELNYFELARDGDGFEVRVSDVSAGDL
jgi:hypothetical protein